MVLYNVTVGIDKEIEKEWLAWMKEVYIPKVMKTGYFLEYRIFRVLNQEQEETTSYSIQYFSESVGRVAEYLENLAPALIREHNERYQNRHVAFRTLLEQVK